MNHLHVFAIIFAFCFLLSDAANYSSRLDAIDIDEILKSERLLKNYFECLMERGPCTAEGSELRRTIPDALKTECEKCSEGQKKKAAKAIEYFIQNKPEMYKELEEKYDPDKIYRARVREHLHIHEANS